MRSPPTQTSPADEWSESQTTPDSKMPMSVIIRLPHGWSSALGSCCIAGFGLARLFARLGGM